MRPDVIKYLQDAQQACSLLEAFTRGKSFGDYQADALLQAGVERKFIIIGEALMQASKLEAKLGQSISALPQIVGFRNVLVHGYAVVQPRTVWGVLENDLALLQQQLHSLLAQAGPP